MSDLQADLPTLCLALSSFFTRNGMTSMPHPPYSPDTFASVEEVKQKVAEVLNAIKTDEFKSCLSSGNTSPLV